MNPSVVILLSESLMNDSFGFAWGVMLVMLVDDIAELRAILLFPILNNFVYIYDRISYSSVLFSYR